MSNYFQNKLLEVKRHFNENDVDLGYRHLIDCAFETNNIDIFSVTLDFCEWYDEENKDELEIKVNTLINKMEQCDIIPVYEKEEQLLNIRNLSKTYSKGNFSLRDVSFTLDRGEIIGLVGENGNGKTTLLRLIAKELEPDSGEIEYNLGSDLKDDYQLRTSLIYIEQRIPRWFGTLHSNLQFAVACHGIKGYENILRTELMIARLGLRPYRHLTWNRISSGYKTRFELAKTLLRNPKILLLDEPLANLDLMSQQTILQDLKFMSKSLTNPFGIILSSQHIYEVEKVSEKIIFLKNGIPQYDAQSASENNKLIIELELQTGNKKALHNSLHLLGLEKISYNGGVYLLIFNEKTSAQKVLSKLSADEINIQYFRNISQSSRRFFIN